MAKQKPKKTDGTRVGNNPENLNNPNTKSKKPYGNYTEEQKQEFCELAAKVGVAEAREILGYPSNAAGWLWAEAYGITAPKSALASHSALIRHLHGEGEKLALCHLILDKAYSLLMEGTEQRNEDGEPIFIEGPNGETIRLTAPTTPNDLSKLAGVVDRIVRTMELLEGRATDRSEILASDSTDIEIKNLIEQIKSRNNTKKEEIIREEVH